MNYYIQGDAANADKINAAFEKLGYDTTGHLFNAKSVLYFTLDGGIRATTCNCTPAIIKTHPDYKELELPVDSKFNIGDWVVNKDGKPFSNGSHFMQIANIVDHYQIWFTSGTWTSRLHLRLWSIDDAKEGDVLANDHHILILKELVYDWSTNGTPNSVNAYCGIKSNGNFELGKEHWCFCGTLHIHPATKEQRDLLFRKMEEAGYEWDADKKELRKIQPHYDISYFMPKQWVLVRDCDNQVWGLSRFSHRDMGCFICINRVDFRQCIPLEGNEKLLGTTDPCPKEFINW